MRFYNYTYYSRRIFLASAAAICAPGTHAFATAEHFQVTKNSAYLQSHACLDCEISFRVQGFFHQALYVASGLKRGRDCAIHVGCIKAQQTCTEKLPLLDT